jgi:flagella basal body P-ring formation protein FlgA
MKASHCITISILFLCLCIGTQATAANDVLLDKIQKVVKENLTNSLSDKAELEELRVVKGIEYFGDASREMTIQNIYMDGYSGRNKVIYAVYLKDRSSKTVNVVVEATYDVFEDVYVTARALTKGDALNQDDYYTVRQKLSKLPAGAITDKHEIEGKILKASLSDGVILRSNFLISALTVKRGKKVSVIVEGENVVLSAKGTLRSDTMVGESANVQCDLTKKEVSGVLISPTLVKVKI